MATAAREDEDAATRMGHWHAYSLLKLLATLIEKDWLEEEKNWQKAVFPPKCDTCFTDSFLFAFSSLCFWLALCPLTLTCAIWSVISVCVCVFFSLCFSFCFCLERGEWKTQVEPSCSCRLHRTDQMKKGGGTIYRDTVTLCDRFFTQQVTCSFSLKLVMCKEMSGMKDQIEEEIQGESKSERIELEKWLNQQQETWGKIKSWRELKLEMRAIHSGEKKKLKRLKLLEQKRATQRVPFSPSSFPFLFSLTSFVIQCFVSMRFACNCADFLGYKCEWNKWTFFLFSSIKSFPLTTATWPEWRENASFSLSPSLYRLTQVIPVIPDVSSFSFFLLCLSPCTFKTFPVTCDSPLQFTFPRAHFSLSSDLSPLPVSFFSHTLLCSCCIVLGHVSCCYLFLRALEPSKGWHKSARVHPNG